MIIGPSVTWTIPDSPADLFLCFTDSPSESAFSYGQSSKNLLQSDRRSQKAAKSFGGSNTLYYTIYIKSLQSFYELFTKNLYFSSVNRRAHFDRLPPPGRLPEKLFLFIGFSEANLPFPSSTFPGTVDFLRKIGYNIKVAVP